MYSYRLSISNSGRTKLLKQSFIFVFLLLSAYCVEARNFYFSSSSGNDSYSTTQAQNQATPWRSITKLNAVFSILVGGDAVYFKRGDVFYGGIIVNKSGSNGNPIVISAYGTGERPIISGFTSLTGWASAGNGIYQATASGISNQLNMVTFNNQPQIIGRYPNATAANGGYLNYDSYNGNTSITDNQLSGTPNWTGADLVLRKAKHVIERSPISSHSGTVLNFVAGTLHYRMEASGYGYFFQKDIKCLDQLGEWYYNTGTRYLQMYFGSSNPSSHSVRVSTVDYLLNTSRYSFISVSELQFEGANIHAVNIGSTTTNTSNITVRNCDIDFSGTDGIYATNTDYPRFEYCNINNSYNMAIEVENEGGISTFTNINHNTLRNSGVKAGMGSAFGDSYQAVSAMSTDAVIEYNNIDSTGYIGIAFYYNNAKVRNNFITNFSFIKDDGGGIYTWTGPVGGPVYSGREVKNNIILNAIGAGFGTPNRQKTAHGIYMDDGVVGVDISGNSIAHTSVDGIYIHNAHEINVSNNTVYNSELQQILFVHDNITPTDPIRNVTFKKNIMVAKSASQLCYNIRTIKDDISQMGTSDSNYYARPADDDMVISALTSVRSTSYSVDRWKANFKKDAQSKKSPKEILPYKINSLSGSNKVSNGDFLNAVTGLLGISAWSQNGNQQINWDGSRKLSGIGSMRINFPISVPNIYTILTKSVGALSSSKNYILRVTSLGSTPDGVLRAYLRNGAAPLNTLVPIQVSSFNASPKTHEFLFTGPASVSAASLVLEVQQTSGTTYLDNIELVEANTTPVDVEAEIRFEFNPTTSPKTIALDAKYIGVDGTKYNGSTLQPYTSKILFRDGEVTAAALDADATAPNISCFGGTTTVTVNASGGRAPYTGTGSFTVNAGKGSIRIGAASPVPNEFTSLYSSIGAISSSKNYVLRFSTWGQLPMVACRQASGKQTVHGPLSLLPHHEHLVPHALITNLRSALLPVKATPVSTLRYFNHRVPHILIISRFLRLTVPVFLPVITYSIPASLKAISVLSIPGVLKTIIQQPGTQPAKYQTLIITRCGMRLA
ncbi:MAG: right-handed parallel beta-helix repeat-containing protein [Ferruginibacter sp.]